MSYPINAMLIPGLPQDPYRHGVGAFEGVVIHSTDVWGDSAEVERKSFADHWKEYRAFVHFFVDHDSIVQTADTRFRAWGAGKAANDRYVHIEMCQPFKNATEAKANKDKFMEIYKRTVWLAATILRQKRLGVVAKQTVWSHHWVTQILGGTTHEDPDDYLALFGLTMDKMVADIKAAYDEMDGVQAVKQATFTRVLKLTDPMMKGDDVAALQRRLEIDKAGHKIDGVFGPITKQAVVNWQKAHPKEAGGKTDGVVDKALWDALFPSPAPQVWRVEVGPFSSESTARQWVDRLKTQGAPAYIIPPK